MITISPQTLVELRKKRGWTQKQLAKASAVSLRQVVVLEAEPKDGGYHTVRETTAEKLAAAFGVTVRTLESKESVPPSHDVHVAVSMPATTQFSYELIEREYGIGRDKIVEMAPMLLMIVFEQSLAWRRQMLDEATAALDAWETFGQWAETDTGMEELRPKLEEERIDIDRRAMLSPSYLADMPSNRFLDYLEYCCRSIPRDQVEMIGLRKVDLVGAETGIRVPYNVCRQTVYDLCGMPHEHGARRALLALLMRSVRISDIPDHLLEPDARQARIAWLADHVDEPHDGYLVDCFPSYHSSTEYAATHSPALESDVKEEHDH